MHAANIEDRDGAKLAFAKAKGMGPWLRMEHVWADGGGRGQSDRLGISLLCQWVLEIVERNDHGKGFSSCRSVGWSNEPSPGYQTIGV